MKKYHFTIGNKDYTVNNLDQALQEWRQQLEDEGDNPQEFTIMVLEKLEKLETIAQKHAKTSTSKGSERKPTGTIINVNVLEIGLSLCVVLLLVKIFSPNGNSSASDNHPTPSVSATPQPLRVVQDDKMDEKSFWGALGITFFNTPANANEKSSIGKPFSPRT